MSGHLSPGYWEADAAAQRREARVAWFRRNARWFPLWVALGAFLFFAFLVWLGK